MHRIVVIIPFLYIFHYYFFKGIFHDIELSNMSACFLTRFQVLLVSCKVMAPFTPFFTEVLYQNMRKVSNDSEESIHFCSFPVAEGKVWMEFNYPCRIFHMASLPYSIGPQICHIVLFFFASGHRVLLFVLYSSILCLKFQFLSDLEEENSDYGCE